MNDDNTLRANIIDGIVRTMMVAKTGVYDKDSNPDFDKFDIRSAVAMALELYTNQNKELIDMMNKITTR